MATFYSDIDKRSFFSEPQFTRTRHRYRGPRETFKINLEVAQMTFMMHQLYERYNNIETAFTTSMALLVDGGAVTGVENEAAQSVVLAGLSDLEQRLIRLQARLTYLEGL